MSNKALYFIGAAALEIISIAGIFAVKYFKQKRAVYKRLQKLELQLFDVQNEIKQLRLLQNENKKSQDDIESSDSEFYELSDTEDIPISGQPSYTTPCPQTLKEFDEKLRIQDVLVIKEVLNHLIDLNQEFPENPEILWRIGEAHQKISVATIDEAVKLTHVNNGIVACEQALKLEPNSKNTQKWFTILIGARTKLQSSLTAKIKDAKLFKIELDKALALNPRDGYLQYVLGRYVYEIANMTWYERKAVSYVFENPPTGSFEEALEYCLKAERLMKDELKDTKLTIANCQIALGNYKDAVDSLKKANMYRFESLDIAVNEEINILLKKYSNYG